MTFPVSVTRVLSGSSSANSTTVSMVAVHVGAIGWRDTFSFLHESTKEAPNIIEEQQKCEAVEDDLPESPCSGSFTQPLICVSS